RELLAQVPPATESALRQLEAAEVLNPTNAVYLVMHAELLRQNGAWGQVLSLAKRAQNLEPNMLQARLLYAEAALRLGQAEMARGALDAACELNVYLEPRRIVAGGKFEGYERFMFTFDRQRYETLARSVGARLPCR
ncbi:MAG: CDC27 family protein, partial [Elusimicrobiota bacterium]